MSSGDGNAGLLSARRARPALRRRRFRRCPSDSPRQRLRRRRERSGRDYGAWSYFQSIDSPENRRFRRRDSPASGPNAAVSDPIEVAYVSVRPVGAQDQNRDVTRADCPTDHLEAVGAKSDVPADSAIVASVRSARSGTLLRPMTCRLTGPARSSPGCPRAGD